MERGIYYMSLCLFSSLQVFTKYGKCYMFNSGEEGRPLLTTVKGGTGNGLEIMLDIQQDEYLPIWGETGMSFFFCKYKCNFFFFCGERFSHPSLHSQCLNQIALQRKRPPGCTELSCFSSQCLCLVVGTSISIAQVISIELGCLGTKEGSCLLGSPITCPGAG